MTVKDISRFTQIEQQAHEFILKDLSRETLILWDATGNHELFISKRMSVLFNDYAIFPAFLKKRISARYKSEIEACAAKLQFEFKGPYVNHAD